MEHLPRGREQDQAPQGGHGRRLSRGWGRGVYQQGRPDAVPGEHGHHGHHPREVQVQAARSGDDAQDDGDDPGGDEEHDDEHLHLEGAAREPQLRADDGPHESSFTGEALHHEGSSFDEVHQSAVGVRGAILQGVLRLQDAERAQEHEFIGDVFRVRATRLVGNRAPGQDRQPEPEGHEATRSSRHR